MTNTHWTAIALAVTLVTTGTVASAQADFALVGGKVVTVVGPPIARGTVLVRGGKIVAVGADVKVPEGVETIDVSGHVVMPGMIDLASHLGLSGALEEGVDPIALDVHAADAFDPFAKAFKRARSSGVTSFVLTLGDRNIVAGRAAVVKMPRADQGLPTFLHRAGAIKMQLGLPPSSSVGSPTSRLGAFALLRASLADATKRDAFSRIARRMGVVVSIDRAGDATAAIRFGREYGFVPCLVGTADVKAVAAAIGRARAAVAFGPFHLAMTDREYAAPAAVAAAGGRVGFASRAPRSRPHDLRATAALAVRGGLDADVALRGLTLTAAEIAGVATRVGSLETGKDADLVVLTGDPIALTSRVVRVFIDGRTAWSADSDAKGDHR